VQLDGLLLQYHDHRGHPELRRALAHGLAVTPDQVLTTVGAAAALFMVATSLLEASDHLVVVRPNYATNIETPRAIGCAISYLDLRFEQGWRVDVQALTGLIRPTTRLVSLTCPHNPTGTNLDAATLAAVVDLCEQRGVYLLVDETYREMTFGAPLPTAVSLSPRAISISSLSKTYGLPGLRIGYLACRDPELYQTLLAAKEQIFICNSIVDEEIAAQALRRRPQRLAQAKGRIAAGFDLMRKFMAAQSELEWVEPSGGVVGFPRIRSSGAAGEAAGQAPAHIDLDRFYAVLADRYATAVGPGHWFEQPRHYMRIGYGWPTLAALEEGLANITRALADARR
jgi:aspartate/methionine/tyrosine aminotransferase